MREKITDEPIVYSRVYKCPAAQASAGWGMALVQEAWLANRLHRFA